MTEPRTTSTVPARQRANAIRNNRETVQSYELCAPDYAATTQQRSQAGENTLRLLVDALGGAGTVLEIGSGPGWDADFFEEQGLSVRRTDVTEAFLSFQAERGRKAERLDLIEDELGGPYDGIVALYVLQHIDRTLVSMVLGKVAAALRPGGAFLVSLREGTGEASELGRQSGNIYHLTL
jgi:2-polyprenyl-3-methyl-5-hydroxy-6-metoxy-1,4-benzoquinol methylase